MAYLHFSSHTGHLQVLAFFDQNLEYLIKSTLMETVTDLFDQTGFISFRNQNLNFKVYKYKLTKVSIFRKLMKASLVNYAFISQSFGWAGVLC